MSNQKLVDDLQRDNIKLKNQIIELNSLLIRYKDENIKNNNEQIDNEKKVNQALEIMKEDIDFLTDELSKAQNKNEELRAKIVQLRLTAAEIKRMSVTIIDKVLENFLDAKDKN